RGDRRSTRAKTAKFPAFYAVTREPPAETGSLETPSSSGESANHRFRRRGRQGRTALALTSEPANVAGDRKSAGATGRYRNSTTPAQPRSLLSSHGSRGPKPSPPRD